jgi:hypothetical protein
MQMKKEAGRMKKFIKTRWLVCGCFCILNFACCISTPAFEGRINAVMTGGSQTDALLYTVGTNFLRVEMTTTNWPNPMDILNRNSGELTLVFPNNRSFVRLQNGGAHAPSRVPADALSAGVGREARPTAPEAGALPMPARQTIGPTNLPGMPAPPSMPAMPNMPPGVGPQSAPRAPAMPGMSGGMPAMPMMRPPMMEQMELKATGEKTNLLGFACEQYEIKQRGETMEIWATDQLVPFQPYVQNQPHRFGPRMIDQQWGDPLQAKKLFPLLATLKFDNGTERFRFEV